MIIEQLSILDITGKLILTQYNDKVIDINMLATGNYIVSIQTAEKIFQKSLIIK